jgi:rRNA maturation protein Nop10
VEDAKCPKCGYDLENEISSHSEHDEMYSFHSIQLTCPKCGGKIKVYMSIEYVVELVQ